jgi:hypothetical protein
MVIRRMLRLGLLLGVLAGVAIALTKLLSNQEPDGRALATRPSEPWPRLTSDPAVASAPTARAIPDPEAPAPPSARTTAAWVEPTGGVCPTSHPVKAKLASKIFHVPGMANYERTNPDRCYVDATAAEADGLRAAKR